MEPYSFSELIKKVSHEELNAELERRGIIPFMATKSQIMRAFLHLKPEYRIPQTRTRQDNSHYLQMRNDLKEALALKQAEAYLNGKAIEEFVKQWHLKRRETIPYFSEQSAYKSAYNCLKYKERKQFRIVKEAQQDAAREARNKARQEAEQKPLSLFLAPCF